MTDPPRRGAAAELGRYLEIQNLGLNLPFAIGFLVIVAGGLPPLLPCGLIVVAFVAARNAGHSFNRWADRAFDAANPRTQDRALVTGRYSPSFALAFALASGAVLVAASFLLNRLAFVLSFVALALVFGYSYTKRVSDLTTSFLGLVEAVIPAAVFIALDGSLPLVALLAVGAMLAWGTAFETVHSVGDLETDRALGLHSLPVRWGRETSVRIVPVLHATALVLFGAFGLFEGLRLPYYVGLGVMALLVAWTDRGLLADPTSTRTVFRRHFLLSATFLVAALAAVWLPLPGLA